MFNQVRLSITPSFTIAAGILLPYIALCTVVITRDISFSIKLLVLFIALIPTTYYLLMLASLSLKNTIVEIDFAENQLKLKFKNGAYYPAELREDYYISRYFCVVSFKLHAQSSPSPNKEYFKFRTINKILTKFIPSKFEQDHHLILCPNNIASKSDFRRLRVLIKHKSTINT